MKAHYKTKNGRITFEVQSETAKGLFGEIADLQSIFECDDKCGCCQSADIIFNVRTHDGNDFYEMVCRACTAQLSFGQLKDNRGLYLKRKDKDGVLLANNGWRVYQRGASVPAPREAAARGEKEYAGRAPEW